MRIPTQLLLGLLLVAPSFGQGNSCYDAEPISGEGSFAYDLTGFGDAPMDFGGSPCVTTIDDNGFFVWTATDCGDFRVDTCGTVPDNALQVAVGSGCDAVCLINASQNATDQDCTMAKTLLLRDVSPGDTFLFEVGDHWTGFPLGTLNVTAVLPDHNTCSTPDIIVGTGQFAFDGRWNTSSGFDGGTPLVCAPIPDVGAPIQDYFIRWSPISSGDYEIRACFSTSSFFGQSLSVYDGPGCSATCLFNVRDCEVNITNVSGGDSYLIQVGHFFSGENLGPKGTVNITAFSTNVANDNCATPEPISGTGTFVSGSGTRSYFTGGNPLLCGVMPLRDVFFAWTPLITGDYAFHNCPLMMGAMGIYEGSDCDAVCIGEGIVDHCGTQERRVLRNAQAGTTYLLQVPGSTAFNPTFQIDLAPPGPPNDTCMTPTVIQGLGSFATDRTGASSTGFDGGGSLACQHPWDDDPFAQDIFYLWSPTSPGTYLVDMCVPGATAIQVHAGSDCSATCVGATVPLTCSLAASGVLLQDVTPADEFLIQIGDRTNGKGQPPAGSFDISLASPAPTNDTCLSPEAITGTGLFGFDLNGARISGFEGGGAPCGDFTDYLDVFFLWTAPADGSYGAEVIDAPCLLFFAFHDGSDCSATCLGETAGGSFSLRATHDLGDVQAGDQFLIQISSRTSPDPTTSGIGTGVGTFSILENAPIHDTPQSPALIVGEGTYPWDNTLAGTSGYDGGNQGLCMSGANLPGTPIGPCIQDLFWRWSPTCHGDYRFDTEGSPVVVETKMNLLRGDPDSIGGGVCITSDNDSGSMPAGSSSIVLTDLAPWDVIIVQVGAYAPTSPMGEGLLNITRLGEACNDTGIEVLCSPAEMHHEGGRVTLSRSTLSSGLGSGLHLLATEGPIDEFGFFLVAPSATSTTAAFSGVLCLDMPIGQYNANTANNQGLPSLNSIGRFNCSGTLMSTTNNGTSHTGQGFDVPVALPFSPPGQVIQPGDTWYFQLWYRDQVLALGDSANFSDVVGVTFP